MVLFLNAKDTSYGSEVNIENMRQNSSRNLTRIKKGGWPKNILFFAVLSFLHALLLAMKNTDQIHQNMAILWRKKTKKGVKGMENMYLERLLSIYFLYVNTCLTMSVQVSSSRTLDTTDRHRMFSSYTAGFSCISSVKSPHGLGAGPRFEPITLRQTWPKNLTMHHLIQQSLTHSATPHPLGYASPTRQRLTHSAAPHPLSYVSTHLRLTHSATPHFLSYASATQLRLTHLATPHPLSYASPTQIRLTHLATPHLLSSASPTQLRLTHSAMPHLLSYASPTQLRLTNSDTPHPLSYATPILTTPHPNHFSHTQYFWII
jgi:hypothetical protein